MSCVFGPVPSRRLGRSLGVDLIPFKTCSYDCIYCQLNTATRPPAEPSAHPVSPVRMQEIAARFSPVAEVIADYRNVHAQADFSSQKDAVMDLLSRRPCTIEDIAAGLGIHRNEVVKYIEELTDADQLTAEKIAEKTFYKKDPDRNKR